MVASWDRRPPEEQERVRDLLLGEWLPQVVTTSPYWRERAREVGVTASDLGRAPSLAPFRPIREIDVLATGPAGTALVMRPSEGDVKALAPGSLLRRVARAVRRGGGEAKRLTLLQEYKPVHVHEAGTAGRLANAYTRSDLDRAHRAGARAAAVLGLDDRDRVLSLVPVGPHLDHWGVHHLALGASMLSIHPRHERVDAGLARATEKVPPTVVVVPVEQGVDLAAELLEEGADLAAVKTVVVVGPPPPAEQREALQDAWRAAGAVERLRVRAAWAPSECRALWVECAQGTHGLHTFPDLEVLELIDPITGQRVPDDGDLAYTSLTWHGTALVRYQTGAYVERLEAAPCPGCGRTTPRLTGEIAPAAWQVEATRVEEPWYIDFRGAAVVLAAQSGLETWRVEVRPGDLVLAEVAGVLEADARAALEGRLASACGAAAARIEHVPDAALVDRHAEELGSVFADVR